MMRMQKGYVKRTPQQEAALRVRMLDGEWAADLYEQCIAQMGSRGGKLGPIDPSRCVLESYVQRLARAYAIPPMVTGLSEDLARAIGDASSSTTIQRYAVKQGRPMPTVMQAACRDALGYRLGCNWVGVAVGWTKRGRPSLTVIPPDELEVTYASDDPLSPTAIRWTRSLDDGTIATDVSDLTDLENPSYRIEVDDSDATEDLLGETLTGEAYWWRYQDNRPFHRIIISGDPLHPYRNLKLVEGTLRVGAAWTHWFAGLLDAAYPSRHAIGLDLLGHDSDPDGGGAGVETGPEVVHRWVHESLERPGQLIQLGPGFDPEIIGRAIRTYELGLLTASGLPVDWEGTGGEPSATEQEQLRQAIELTYPDCRGQDVLLLRRLAAVCNRAGEAAEERGEPRPYPPLPEGGYGVSYGEEVREQLKNTNAGADDDSDAGRTGEEAGRDDEGDAEASQEDQGRGGRTGR